MNKFIICVVTGSRAEYGLLRRLILLLNRDPFFELKLVVTGAHLSKKFGYTIDEIYNDKLPIFRTIDIELEADKQLDICRSSSKALVDFGNLFKDIKPNLLLILGDRYEILSVVIAACFERIPIAHIHGGELTEGLIDDAIRHAITKFSHLHFVATQEYKKRVIQLGERPSNVFNVGALGIDAMKSTRKISKLQIENQLGFKFKDKSLLITYHPVTLDEYKLGEKINELLKVLNELEETTLIFTMPNADPGNQIIYKIVENFARHNTNSFLFKSLGRELYFSILENVDAVVGNSSSGILEVPYFNIPTINIGDRQKGRILSKSIISADLNYLSISKAIKKVYDKSFLDSIQKQNYLFGNGGSSKKIIDIIKKFNFDNILKKQFYDIKEK